MKFPMNLSLRSLTDASRVGRAAVSTFSDAPAPGACDVVEDGAAEGALEVAAELVEAVSDAVSWEPKPTTYTPAPTRTTTPTNAAAITPHGFFLPGGEAGGPAG
ncbi:hypothetical protein QQ44_27790 [Mycolicibacterium setense]|uniref:Uncharacterized protein n=1 Tax=Mycolicibacterium setense TaxID=431269 RepID=A0ABR4YNP1_9MYCO|nr:hypothetical protein QQ44_27790 [Mycolicibacterium setense]